MSTEADTCRKYVLPKLIEAGWDDEPHSFTEHRGPLLMAVLWFQAARYAVRSKNEPIICYGTRVTF